MKKFVGGAVALIILIAAIGSASGKKAETHSASPTGGTVTTAHISHSMTESQKNAIDAANSYLEMSAFSRQGLIEQLSSKAGDGYPMADAVFAVDHIKVDWKQQAVKSARQYLSQGSFSRQGLIDQLSSPSGEGFTLAQAQYGVSKAYN